MTDAPSCHGVPMEWTETFELDGRYLECFVCPLCGTPGGVGTDKPTTIAIREPARKVRIEKVRGNLVNIVFL